MNYLNEDDEMSDKEKSISELMDMMRQDSDEFFGKTADLVVGQSGRHYWTEREDPEDRQCRLDSEREFVEDEATLHFQLQLNQSLLYYPDIP